MTTVHLFPYQIDAFLDGELSPAENTLVQTHLAACETCSKLIEDRQKLLVLLRSANDSVPASAHLRKGVEHILQSEVKVVAKQRERWHYWASAAVAALGLIAAFTWFIGAHRGRSSANDFVQAAVTAHIRHAKGNLPLEVETKSAGQLTQWFGPKVQFPFRLPKYEQDGSAPKTYQVLGGSVVPFKGHHAAFVAYRMKNGQPVSLLVTGANQAVAQGGSVVVDRSLTFHSVKHQDLEIVTWTVHGVTYALVSGLDLPPGQSCLVCHSPSQEAKKKRLPVHPETLGRKAEAKRNVSKLT